LQIFIDRFPSLRDQSLFDLFHFRAAGAVARILADGAAFAGRSAGTGIFTDTLVSLGLSLNRDVAVFYLRYCGLHHRLAAGAIPGIHGQSTARAFLSAITGIDLVSCLELHLAVRAGKRDGGNKTHRENNPQNNQKRFLHFHFLHG
jgi:hypothetical protein